jgi:hypothetical protein
MSAGPTLSPSWEDSPKRSAFAHQAANVCLFAPLLIIGLGACVAAVLHNHPGPSLRPLFIIIGFVELGFALLGAVLGIVAVFLAGPHQRGSVAARVAGGILLLGLLTAVAIPNFVRARTLASNKRAAEEVQAAAKSFRAEAASAITNGQTPSLEPLQRSFGRAAEKTSGDTAALFKGSQLFLQQLQRYQEAYAKAANELKSAKVLATSTLSDRRQIQDRKAVVQKFLDANASLRTAVQQSESNFRKELAALGVSGSQTEAALTGFRKSFQGPLLLTIREADERMGHGMLQVLNLFDAQWGKWRFDSNAQILRFQDTTALGQYKSLMAEINQAGTDQQTAQERLLAAANQPNASF